MEKESEGRKKERRRKESGVPSNQPGNKFPV